MTQELSYMHLKSSNEARVSEEQRSEQRKKNLLLLILHFLNDEGYLDTAQALEGEAGVSLKKFEVCDNIDLATILQEYESYYFIKFQKWPKITKRIRDSGDVKSRGAHFKSKPPQRSLSKGNSVALPSINGSGETNTSSSSGSADAKKRGGKSKGSQAQHTNQTISNSPSQLEIGLSVQPITSQQKLTSKDDDMQGKRVIIDHKAILNNAIKGNLTDQVNSTDRLLKPLSGYAGLTGEMRDLAAVISRDIYLENPDVRWSDIIGLEEAKRLVKEAVVYPIKYPQLFTGILSPWKGLLLYGPPGTGKTLLAKAVATECKTTFFNISASSIVSKWRGDSEKLVRVLFELARFHAPSTIFLDELDSLMSQRGASSGGSGEHEGSRRMKTELLVQMDGLAKSDDLVFLLAASNLPWELDHAMLRRLEKRIMVGLPTLAARQKMLRHYLPPVLPSKEGGLELKTYLDYDNLAELMEGYSGSDVSLVCKEAAMRPLRKIFDILEGNNAGDEKQSTLPTLELDPILTEDVEAALERTKPSSRTYAAKYDEWQKHYESV